MTEREEIIKADEDESQFLAYLKRDLEPYDKHGYANIMNMRRLIRIAESQEAKIAALRAELEQAMAARAIPTPSDEQVRSWVYTMYGREADEEQAGDLMSIAAMVLAYARQPVGPVVIPSLSAQEIREEGIATERSDDWWQEFAQRIRHLIARKIPGARLEEDSK